MSRPRGDARLGLDPCRPSFRPLHFFTAAGLAAATAATGVDHRRAARPQISAVGRARSQQAEHATGNEHQARSSVGDSAIDQSWSSSVSLAKSEMALGCCGVTALGVRLASVTRRSAGRDRLEVAIAGLRRCVAAQACEVAGALSVHGAKWNTARLRDGAVHVCVCGWRQSVPLK